jgi:MFS family permease
VAVVEKSALPAGAPAAPAQAPSSATYAFYIVVLLTFINITASIDRRVINIVAEPIRNELHLADWQIGMMAGLAFAIFYGALGFPIARLTDRGDRRLIISGSLAVWSAFTALSGTAANFVQLFLYRMGVGIGEAGSYPPAQTLIMDYVPKEKRSSAMAFWSMGVPLGTLFGFPLGALVADHYGWRAAFFVVGVPGLLLAVITYFTMRETRSLLRDDLRAAKASQPSWGAMMKVLATKRTYWILLVNTAVKMINTYGLQAFVVSFFLRAHKHSVAVAAASLGLKSLGFLGITIGVISGVCGAISILLGGFIADRSAAKDIRNTMLAPAYGGLVALPLTIMALSIHNVWLALACFSIPYLLNGFGYGPVTAVMQGVVPSNMRATSSAMALFLEILIGQAAGPVLVGLMSDWFAHSLGAAEGLRWSLICSSCLAIPCAVLYLAARKTMREDMES